MKNLEMGGNAQLMAEPTKKHRCQFVFFPGMEGQHQQNKMIPARSSKALPVVQFFGKTSKFG
jgi:hypothetical protein